MDYFKFPYCFEDILKPSTQYYCVQIDSQRIVKQFDDKKMQRYINDMDSQLKEDCTRITQSDIFDVLYFIIDSFGTGNNTSPSGGKFNIKTIEQMGELLATFLNLILKNLKLELTKATQDSGILLVMLSQSRQVFKMIVFLTTFYLRNTFVKSLDSDSISGKQRKKSEAAHGNNFQILVEVQKLQIDLLVKCLRVDFKRLFERKDVEEEFYKYFLNTALRMMESQPLMRMEKARIGIFQIIQGVMVIMGEERKQELKQVQLSLIGLIYEEEQLVQPIADFIVDMYKDKTLIFAKEFTFSFLQTLVTFLQEKTNPNSETNVFKNARDFFSVLSNNLPKMFINNLSCFLTLFDSESYLMRNTVCEIISNILKNVLTAQNEEEEEYVGDEEAKIKQKERLIDKIIDRVFDKHAYCRANVLNLLSDLCENNIIPPQFLPHILKAAIGRTRDVGAIVRRKALQLITRVVNYYVYIYQATKESKFMTKEQVFKEIRKLEVQAENAEQQLEIIDKKMRDLANQCDDEEQILQNQDEMEQLLARQKSVTGAIALCGQLYARYKDYQDFLFTIDVLVPILVQLLGSKSVYDVMETIRLLMYLKKFNIASSEMAIKKMMVLVWTKDKLVKEEVLSAYWTLYFNTSEFKPKVIAKNLINLMMDTNISEACSIEELIISMLNSCQQVQDENKQSTSPSSYPIETAVFSEIWEIFFRNFRRLCEAVSANERTEAEALEQEKELIMWKKEMRSGIQILRIVCTRIKFDWNLKLESFKNILVFYKKCIGKVDWVVVKELAGIAEQVKSSENIELVKQIVQFLGILLIRSHGTEDSEWFIASDAIIKVAFLTFANPEAIIKYLIKQMSSFICQPSGVDDKGRIFEHKLAHVLYIAGNSALKFLMHCERIDEYLNKRRIEAEETKRKQKENNDMKSQENINADKDDKEIDKISGGLEAEYEEHQRTLHNIQDRLIIESPIFSYFCHISQKICWNIFNSLSLSTENKQNSDLLRRNAILDRVSMLCLIKFMCVSSGVCEKNLELIFHMLEADSDPIIKTNVLIGIGDLYHRYPNIIEKYLPFVYKSLSDKNNRVRKTCLMVITHLVLNDMLKVKAEISSIAVLIQDEDIRIQNMVKLFFHELNKKDPKAIYNLLPELIGRLSTEKVDSSVFLNFCENVLPHIDKDKQSELLIEKLCQRFSLTHTEKEWVNISHALKMFQMNEKSLKKLLEYFESYREKLEVPSILENFKSVIARAKKTPRMSAEQKQLLEEFESKVINFRKETFDESKFKKEKPKPRGSNSNNNSMIKQLQLGNIMNKSNAGNKSYLNGVVDASKKGQQQQQKKQIRQNKRRMDSEENSEVEGEDVEEEYYEEQEDEVKVVQKQTDRLKQQQMSQQLQQSSFVRGGKTRVKDTYDFEDAPSSQNQSTVKSQLSQSRNRQSKRANANRRTLKEESDEDGQGEDHEFI